MLGIGGHCLERLRSGPEEDAVHNPFVLQGKETKFPGQGKDHVYVRDGQQLHGARFHPFRARQGLALGAMAITTRVILNPFVAAAITLLKMAS
jgi:hypothetical protein